MSERTHQILFLDFSLPAGNTQHTTKEGGVFFLNNLNGGPIRGFANVTINGRYGLDVQPLPFKVGDPEVIENLDGLIQVFRDSGLRPYKRRLFYFVNEEALDQELQQKSEAASYGRRVVLDDESSVLVGSSEMIPAGTVVEVMKGTGGSFLLVAPLRDEGDLAVAPEEAFRFLSWEEAVQAILDSGRVPKLTPAPPRVERLIVLAVSISHPSNKTKAMMRRETIDLPNEEIGEIFLVRADDRPETPIPPFTPCLARHNGGATIGLWPLSNPEEVTVSAQDIFYEENLGSLVDVFRLKVRGVPARKAPLAGNVRLNCR